jgi:hypothetical protein
MSSSVILVILGSMAVGYLIGAHIDKVNKK